MKTLFMGATKGMGQALARLMAQRGDELFLIGRDLGEMEKTALDLKSRSGKSASVAGMAHCDLADSQTFTDAFFKAENALGGLDAVVVTAALFSPQEELEEDAERTEALLTVNFTHTILFCEEARKRLLKRGGGTLCVFSSVAGDRARKPSVLYGATKAGLSYYLEGLDHKYRSHGLATICVKPGFVKTGMTAGLKPPPFSGEPDQVARDVLKAIDRKTPLVYTPFMWRWVMLVIRWLPRFVMRKIKF